jgi:hypothetical protein
MICTSGSFVSLHRSTLPAIIAERCCYLVWSRRTTPDGVLVETSKPGSDEGLVCSTKSKVKYPWALMESVTRPCTVSLANGKITVFPITRSSRCLDRTSKLSIDILEDVVLSTNGSAA